MSSTGPSANRTYRNTRYHTAFQAGKARDAREVAGVGLAKKIADDAEKAMKGAIRMANKSPTRSNKARAVRLAEIFREKHGDFTRAQSAMENKALAKKLGIRNTGGDDQPRDDRGRWT